MAIKTYKQNVNVFTKYALVHKGRVTQFIEKIKYHLERQDKLWQYLLIKTQKF